MWQIAHVRTRTRARAPKCTEVRFASFLSGGFTTMAVMNPPEKKLEKHISVKCRKGRKEATELKLRQRKHSLQQAKLE